MDCQFGFRFIISTELHAICDNGGKPQQWKQKGGKGGEGENQLMGRDWDLFDIFAILISMLLELVGAVLYINEITELLFPFEYCNSHD